MYFAGYLCYSICSRIYIFLLAQKADLNVEGLAVRELQAVYADFELVQEDNKQIGSDHNRLFIDEFDQLSTRISRLLQIECPDNASALRREIRNQLLAIQSKLDNWRDESVSIAKDLEQAILHG